MKVKGFAFQHGYDGREITALINYCLSEDVTWYYIRGNEFPDGYIPVGSVEWMETILGPIKPDFYPKFLKDHLHRDIWYRDTFQEVIDDNNKRGLVFIKPSDRYKRFEAGVSNFMTRSRVEDTSYETGPYVCSEYIKFKNEWRYYVANGEVLCGWWYKGEKDTGKAPTLNVKFPKTFCGAVDFGELVSGNMALVESQHPYAIGWYGEDFDNYAKFIISGWKSLIG